MVDEILRDPYLTEDQKQTLIKVYQSLRPRPLRLARRRGLRRMTR